MSPTRSVRGLFTRSSRLATTAVALVIAVLSSLLAGVVLAGPAYAAPSADLDQCANGQISSPVDCTVKSEWVNGNVNESKAHYAEGDSLPYRIVMDDLSLGSHTVTIEWDTTQGGMHALDYLTTFNRTVAAANPCAGDISCGAPSTFPIPVDPNVTNGLNGVPGGGDDITQIPGVFTIYNGTITAVSAYTLSGTYAGNSQTSITITFTATAANPVLAWGGHISTRLDWGMANSAVTISGSPYHTRLLGLDGSGGNQDRSLSASAVIFPASITIIKDAVPNGPQDFGFTTTGGLLPAAFSLDDDADPTLSNTRTFANITTFGAYTVTEAAAAGWTLSFGTPPCTVTSPNGGSRSVNLRTVTINLEEGENVTCTFINSRQSGTLTVNKVVVPANDPGDFNLQIDGGTAGTGANVGNGGTTGAIPVPTGTHTVGETAVDGTDLADYTSSIACTGGITADDAGPLQVTVGNGQNVVCTITNVRRTGTITVIKDLSPSTDAGRFNLLIDGAAPNNGSLAVGDGGTTTAIDLQPGQHTIGEVAAAGTNLANYTSSIACSDGTVIIPGTTVTVDLSSSEHITCTITNVRKTGTITVRKVLSPSTDGGRFNLLIDGVAPNAGSLSVGNNGTTGAIALQPGTHTVAEVAAAGTNLADYTSSIVCGTAPAVPGPGPRQVTLASSQNIVCTITNQRISDCPPTTRTAASRGNDDDDDCYGQDPGDNDPGDPYGEDPIDTTVDDLYVQSPAPTVDPGVGGAGDTTPLQPIDQVVAGNTEQPAPADPGPLGGFLPRTGAGIAGQAMLALLLMAAGLTLRLARRRRSPQA